MDAGSGMNACWFWIFWLWIREEMADGRIDKEIAWINKFPIENFCPGRYRMY